MYEWSLLYKCNNRKHTLKVFKCTHFKETVFDFLLLKWIISSSTICTRPEIIKCCGIWPIPQDFQKIRNSTKLYTKHLFLWNIPNSTNFHRKPRAFTVMDLSLKLINIVQLDYGFTRARYGSISFSLILRSHSYKLWLTWNSSVSPQTN